ncbi:TPA: DUF551 domain-containing protein [Citrobacter freundii]|uniref:DUF551 domain-containing protein n=1 Tax=Citrobacter freundii TaxID=546 RepID=UPI0020238CC0|nr:DUF551 domain-containing protein [Citrobacter freundii]MCY3452768.1 DUF551 domain-containing protein [Citrobacter freundii]HCD1229198.1 DUF551 domain-containing protein [Citrobacter freundii]
MTKFTIEDLRDIAYRGSYDDLERELALQLLASMEQAPVYLRPFGDDGETFVACDGNDERAITLYAAPQLPQPAVFVPSIKPDWMNNEFNAGWNACRTAMLQDGNSPVTPDCWIPVSERMPERDVDVQVYCADKKEQMVGYMERNETEGWFRFASLPNGGGVYCKPTHWMSLPAAPQQAKSQHKKK